MAQWGWRAPNHAYSSHPWPENHWEKLLHWQKPKEETRWSQSPSAPDLLRRPAMWVLLQPAACCLPVLHGQSAAALPPPILWSSQSVHQPNPTEKIEPKFGWCRSAPMITLVFFAQPKMQPAPIIPSPDHIGSRLPFLPNQSVVGAFPPPFCDPAPDSVSVPWLT